MHVTVAICTWNRAALLEKTLEGMLELRIPDEWTWELLVVDNNCTDRTPEVVNAYTSRLPLRCLFERRQGHCFARNCAIEAASGELLIWTDDDVIVDREWLAEYVAASVRWPEAGVFGGAVDPWLEEEPVWWFRRHWDDVKGLFVIRECYVSEFPAPPEVSAVGASMAVRMPLAKQFRFDEKLGRVGATLSGGDDCEWLERMEAAGVRRAWVGKSRVQHFIPKERLTEAFLKKWYQGAGRTNVRMSPSDSSPRLFGAARWMWLPYIRSTVLASLLRPFRTRSWLMAFRRAAILDGMIAETRAERVRQPG